MPAKTDTRPEQFVVVSPVTFGMPLPDSDDLRISTDKKSLITKKNGWTWTLHADAWCRNNPKRAAAARCRQMPSLPIADVRHLLACRVGPRTDCGDAQGQVRSLHVNASAEKERR